MKYTVKLMSGLCQQITNCTIENHKFNMILISRRSRFHMGTRFNTRGLKKGKCANFAETEEIIQIIDDKQLPTNEYYSFCQIRGSIPLHWKQNVTLKYTPSVKLSDDQNKNDTGFCNHMKEITRLYGEITIVNLIDKKKDQLMLGEEFHKYCDKYKSVFKNHYVWFDFHKECKKMHWENLSKLMAEIDDDITRYGYFHVFANDKVVRKQIGICRTNCMDNLDSIYINKFYRN